jgi:hypothetical protein
MTTAREIITKSLQKVGANFQNSGVTGDEATDALYALNALLSSLSNDSMMIYARVWQSFTLTPSTGSYTIGTGGVFNTDKPMLIVSSYLRDGTIDYTLSSITDEMYNEQISQKNTTGIPNYINSDNGNPLATIRLYPVPDKNYQLFLLSEKQLTQLALDDDVAFPAGWERMLIYNLAVDLYPEYGIPPDPLVVKIAEDSKRLVRANTIRNRSMDSNPIMGKTGRFENGWMA